MKLLAISSALAALVSLIAATVAIVALSQQESPTAPQMGSPRPASTAQASNSIQALTAELNRLKASIGNLPPQRAGDPGDEPHTSATATQSVSDRLAHIESTLAKIQASLEGISLESASAEREALFKGEDGNLKADEYFAAQKFAIAGEGYLTFLAEHPEHPDARDIMKQARTAFQKAEYKDKALWVQEEMIKNFPEFNEEDVMTLAHMEKTAGRYSEAIEHAAQAAELASNSQTRLWRRMYWAWFNQLDAGNQAGLEAYKVVAQEISQAGFDDHKLGNRVREKIAEIERDASDR